MLKKLSLKNFKSFESMDDLEIRPITIIAGKNSCGKSSLIQSLLLLKQTLESPLPVQLCLDGRFIKCSSLKELAYRLPAINTASIEYMLHFDDISLNLAFNNKRVNGSYVPTVSKRVLIDKKGNKENIKDIKIGKIRELLKNIGFPVRMAKINKIDFTYNKFTPETVHVDYLSEDGGDEQAIFPVAFLSKMERHVRTDINKEIRGIRYLSPVRAMPERAYLHYSPQVDELYPDGSNSAHVLWSKKDEIVSWNDKRMKLSNAVNKCIECLGLSQKVTPSKIGDVLYSIGVSETLSGGEVSLSDVGFGYSQILPIILMGLVNKDDNLILLEQPEIHLHPSSAANLADLFLTFIKNGSRFIIETHSQELINRLRLRVIENPKLKSKINIVFVDSDTQTGSKIRQFEIDENGMFPAWPDGFLDESEKISEAIINARLKKRKEKRSQQTISPNENSFLKRD
ncbi:TPA: AAA family ATPase [Aeromonas hydrophila]